MMRVLIVDDEALARRRLAALLAECADVTVVGAVADADAAIDAARAGHPDVVLLDINMPGQDGVALARRWVGQAGPRVIFCTAYETHALDAFALDAVDYVLKPVRLDRLRAARRAATTPVYLHGCLAGEQVRIALDDVMYLLAGEKYVAVHHRAGELLIEDSLRQLEEAYPGQLVRLHRNCLAPAARLVGLKTLADGRVLARLDGTEFAPEVSRRNLPAVRKLLRPDPAR